MARDACNEALLSFVCEFSRRGYCNCLVSVVVSLEYYLEYLDISIFGILKISECFFL